MSKPWYSSEIMPPNRPMLSKAEFVKLYLPQYVRDYQSPTGIKMVKGASGGFHVQMSTKASHQARVTKRQNRIDAEFAEYERSKKAQMELDRQATEPLLL